MTTAGGVSWLESFFASRRSAKPSALGRERSVTMREGGAAPLQRLEGLDAVARGDGIEPLRPDQLSVESRSRGVRLGDQRVAAHGAPGSRLRGCSESRFSTDCFKEASAPV